MKKRILIISYRLPWPPYGGGNIARILNIAKIFKKEYEVSILTLIEKKEQKEYINELKKEFNEIIYFFQPRVGKYLNAIEAFLFGMPLQVGYFYSKEMNGWLEKNHQNYDILYFNTIRTAEYVGNFENKKILDLVDAISLNYGSAEKWVSFFWKVIFKIESPRTLKYELKCLADESFKKIFISSVFDKNYLEDNFGRPVKNLVIMPNGMNKKITARKTPNTLGNQISFIGKLNYKPNEDAALYFVKKIFPLLRRKFPELKFYIIGINPTRKIIKLGKEKNIIVTGFVPDVFSVLEESKLIVVPLRFGSGTQYKILEGMALGKAVVTTEIGARGIEGLRDRENIVVCDQDPVKMAEKIENLLKNPDSCKIIGEKAKNFISRNYTWDIIEKKLISEIL